MPRDLTIEVLKQIRDEVRKTNERLDTTNERLEHLENTTTERFERLEKRQVESETRLATELVAVVSAVDRMRELLVDRLDLRDKVEKLDRRVSLLEQRTAQ